MKIIFKLLWSNIKMTFRDKQAIFWSFVFPLMFIVIFGLFDFNKMGTTKYVVIDHAGSDASRQFQSGLDAISMFKKQPTPASFDEAKKLLKAGDIEAVIVIPEDFRLPALAPTDQAQAMPLSIQEPQAFPTISPIKLLYDKSNIAVNQVVLTALDKFINQMNMQAGKTPTLFSYATEDVQSKSIGYIDIIMPGILGMAMMQSAIFGISTGISRYREQKLLKRLSATPLRVRDFLVAEVGSYLFTNIIQISLIILLARIAFGVIVSGNYFFIYLVCIFASVIFLNIGFAIAGYAKNTKSAESLSQVISMPMMFFSGVFFSTEMLPKIIAKVVEYLPLTPAVEALRMISVRGGGLGDISIYLAYMAGWMIVSFLLAWRMFRFKD